MGLRVVGMWLYATHLRRMVAYLCMVTAIYGLLAVIFSGPMSMGIGDLLYWIPMSALFTLHSAREAATAVWLSTVAFGAAVGFGLLGVHFAWISTAVCFAVMLLAYFIYTQRVKDERTADRSWGRVPPQSCWLRMDSGLIPIEIAPGPDCTNCGHPHAYLGYSAFGRVEVDESQNPVIEVDPPEVPVVAVTFTDVDGRRWLVPRP